MSNRAIWRTGKENKLKIPEMGHAPEISYSRDSNDASVAAVNKASG